VSDLTMNKDYLQRLEQLVPLCESIRRGSEYRAALAQAVSDVRRAADVPTRLEGVEPALRLLQGTEHLPLKEVVSDLDQVEAAGSALEQCVNTEALRNARFAVKDLQEGIQRVEAQTCKAWDALVRAEFGPLERLGAVLSEIPDTKRMGIELQKWAKCVLAIRATGTPTADSVRQFDEARAQRAARLETLGKLGIDAAVRLFLLDVANKNATLERITPDVLAWLRSKNAHSRFRIELA
jgi:hypothetical protein